MEIDSADLIFGNCLARLRKGKGYSQKSVALDADLDASYLAGLEHGRRSPPRYEVLSRIVMALHASPEEHHCLKEAVALTKISKIAKKELGDDVGQSLVRLVKAIQLCSVDERKALETIAMGIETREREKGEAMK